MSDSVASLPRAPASAIALRALSDDRLVRLIPRGSEAAFTVLYQRHHQALYRYCVTIVRHEHDAQDVLQTTMVRALTSLQRGAPDAPLRPWLFRIAHNEAISLLRRRRPTEDIDDAHDLAGPALERRLEDRSRLSLLVSDLQALPDRQRGALVMRELSGLSHAEIATTLGISVAGAKQAIFEARTSLQEFARGREMRCAEVERLISDGDGRMLRGRPVRAHLRACPSCSALRDAIGARRSELAALAPPLPVLAATGLLAKILGAGGGHGGGGGGLMMLGAAGKATSAMVAGKSLATAAMVATVGVGATQAVPALRSEPARQANAVTAPAAAAAPTRQATARIAGQTVSSHRSSGRPAPGAASGGAGDLTAPATPAATQPGPVDARQAGRRPRSSPPAPAQAAGRSSSAKRRGEAARAASGGSAASRANAKPRPSRATATSRAAGPSAAAGATARVVPVLPAPASAHPAPAAREARAVTPQSPAPPAKPLVPGTAAP